MADVEPVKDPTKPKFWRVKNIVLLASSAIIPLAAHSVWTWATDRIKDFDEIRDRLKDLEVNAASRNAIWGAINEVKAKQADLDLRITVMQRLFEREWGRGAGAMEKDHAARIAKVESDQRAAMGRLLDRLTVSGFGLFKLDEIMPATPKPKWTDFSQFVPDNDWEKPPAPAPAPSIPPVDPDKLREQYEQKFPPNRPQQQRK